MSLSMKKGLKQEPTGTMFDEQERQKMLRLNRELQEPKEPRLEWIYTGDRNKSDDYLLGKKYDGNTPVDTTTAAAEDESITTSTVDLANKIREDPLFLIKKREIEETKRLLENPVRLKQIKELLEQQESSSSSSHKKRKRHSRSRSRSPNRHRRRRSPSPPPRRRRSPLPPPPSRRRERTPPRPSKQSREERERRIREMLVDGAIRTEQRQENVRRYKERDDKEDKLNEIIRERARKKNDLSSSDDDDEGFIRPMMKQVVNDPSLKRRDLKHHYHKRH